MENQGDALAYVINIHHRLTKDFPCTPYQQWCELVHGAQLSPIEKWGRILAWDLNPSEYKDPRLFRYDWQLFKLLSKFSPGGEPSEEDKAVAYQKFLSAEDRCASVNEYYATSVSAGASSMLLGVSNIVQSVLGPVGDFFDWVESQAQPRSTFLADAFSECYGREETFDSLTAQFGPGVSVGPGDDKLTSVSEKLLLGTVTADCRYLASWLRTVFSGLPESSASSVVRGSRLTFVVKRVGEARTICYEPSMNMLIQKLIGLYLKQRLKAKLGIDLSNQERNRSLARLGSLCDSYATIDLSSASDLIAAIPVLNCVSTGWFRLMDDCRSKEYYDCVAKEWKSFHKFSTMGNGFTFELETLFFAAIVKYAIDSVRNRAIAWREVAVYGDDLLFPREYAYVVEQALLVFGHIPNLKKSFSAGPFRESCGGDYFLGWNVTPFKIKELNLNDPKSVVNVYNGLFISARENPDLHSICCRFARALSFIERWLRSRHHKLSDGYVEKRFSETLVEYVFNPSNRWLFAISPCINVAYSKYVQRIVPKWYLIEQDRPTSRFIRGRQVMLDYMVTDEFIRYTAANGGQHVSIWESTTRFRRNLDLYRAKGTKLVIGTSGQTNKDVGSSSSAVSNQSRVSQPHLPMAHFVSIRKNGRSIINQVGKNSVPVRFGGPINPLLKKF
nr:MAG: RNA replicase beta chain [Sanya fiers-like virus 38]